MKKTSKFILCGVIFSIVGISNVFAESLTENTSQKTQSTAEISKRDSETNQRTLLKKDITPSFEVPSMKELSIGSEGIVEVVPIEGIKDNSGKFIASIEDETVISVNEKGQWKALKEGSTTFSLNYEYSESALSELKKTYPDHEFYQRAISLVVPVVVKEKNSTIDVTPLFLGTDVESAMVGETGQIKVADVEGIVVTGKFSPLTTENGVLTLDEEGRWKALKPGTDVIPLNFEYSQETYDQLAEKYPDAEFISKSIAQGMKITVYDGTISLKPRFDITHLDIKVGDTGKFALAPIGDVTDLSGVFDITDSMGIIEVDKDGNWKAIKSGETILNMNVELTDESKARILEKNPFKQVEPIPEIMETISVKIVDLPATSGDNSNSGSTSKKQLPKTSESQKSNITLVGSLFTLASVLGLVSKRKKKLK